MGEEIMKKNNIEVSIVCNTYNHEKYIREALEGFLKQKTNFKFEVLIHDDASTDHTAEIIKEFEERYPEVIRPIYQSENQYSKGINVTTTFQYPRAKGKYIAFCEGDDFWTDKRKLQKQYELMEKYPEVNMSAHTVKAISNGEEKFRFAPSNVECIFSIEEVIKGGGEFVSTNSLFYRKKMVEKIPEFYKYLGLDYSLQIWGSLNGGMLFLPECMGAYRVATPGSWTVRVSQNRERYVDLKKRTIKMLQVLNIETKNKYSMVIEDKIKEIETGIFITTGNIKELKNKYRDVYLKLTLKKRVKLYLKHTYFLVKKRLIFSNK